MEEVIVSRVSSSSMFNDSRVSSNSKFYVSLVVNKLKLRAVVDTAAEVTVISDRLLPLLDPAPPILKKVILRTAGRGQSMTALKIGPISIKLGQTQFNEIVYCASLDDDMLLGLDFLQKYGIDISITQSKLIVGGEEIHMYYGASSQSACIQKVWIARTAVVPPSSVKHVQCKLEGECRLSEMGKKGPFLFQPTHPLPIWTPRIVFDRGKYFDIYVLNVTDSYRRLPEGTVLGFAEKIKEIQPLESDGLAMRQPGRSRL